MECFIWVSDHFQRSVPLSCFVPFYGIMIYSCFLSFILGMGQPSASESLCGRGSLPWSTKVMCALPEVRHNERAIRPLHLPVPTSSHGELRSSGSDRWESVAEHHLIHLKCTWCRIDSLLSVMRLDGSTPTKFGLRLNMEEKYCGLKHHLNKLSGIPACQLLLVEILGAQVKVPPLTVMTI